MRFRIEPDVFQLFPQLIVGAVVARDVNNRGTNSEVSSALAAAEAVTASLFAASNPREHPNIAAWRDAYRAFGAKPKEHASSIENLARRVSKGQPLPHINLLVDIYNAISLRYLLPVGGEDLDRIRGEIRLTRAAADEPPVKLLGDPEERAPNPGEVIYRDDLGAICRRFNWREADRTRLTGETRNAILIIEGLPPVDEGVIRGAIADLSQHVQRYCGGTTRAAILSSRQPDFLLTP